MNITLRSTTTLLAAILALAIIAAPASAAPAPADCALGHLCLYEHRDFQGEKLLDINGSDNRVNFFLPRAKRDRVSSWSNRTFRDLFAINYRLGGVVPSHMWSMPAQRQQTFVGGSFNDKLDEISRQRSPF